MQKKISESTKVVGVWQDLIGSITKQMLELIIKLRQVHSAITKSPQRRHLVWTGIRQDI